MRFDQQAVDALVTLNGEQDAYGFADGGHAGYTGVRLNALQTASVVAQGRLVQAEGFDQVVQRPAQVDITDLVTRLPLPFFWRVPESLRPLTKPERRKT